MIECGKCHGKCKDEALYCVHCGERLDTAACRKCGNFVKQDDEYCAHCGYPTSGAICPKCGKSNSDDANFCSVCGSKLGMSAARTAVSGGNAGGENFVTPSASDNRTAEPRAAAETGGGKQSKKMYAYKVSRAFVLPALLLCIFISSFFGMFKMNVPLGDMGFGSGMDMDLDITGVDAVRGMFLLIDPPAEEDVYADFEEFLMDYMEDVSISGVTTPAKLKRLMKDAIEEFGVLRLVITEDNVSSDVALQVVVWGLQTLAMIAVSFVFFILSLIHAVYLTIGKRKELYKREAASLALMFALSFAFVMTGGALAGGAAAIIALSALGLSGGIICNYAVEKKPRPSLAVNLRRGICAALVIMMACFASADLMNIHYDAQDGSKAGKNLESSYDAADLYSGMNDVWENSEDIFEDYTGDYTDGNDSKVSTAMSLDEMFLNLLKSGGDYGKGEKNLMLKIYGHPALIAYSLEAKSSYADPASACAVLLWIFNILFAASVTMLMYDMLCEEATEKKSRTVKVWHILSLVGAVGILGFTIPFVAMGNDICKTLEIGFRYSINAFPILAVIFGAAALIVYFAMSKAASRKKEDPHPLAQSTESVRQTGDTGEDNTLM